MSDGCEYQDIVPFDDTIIADSPSLETQLENLHDDTEILDIDIDKEVVLDSDDEGMQGTEALMTNKLPSGIDTNLEANNVLTGKRQLSPAPATDQSYVGSYILLPLEMIVN